MPTLTSKQIDAKKAAIDRFLGSGKGFSGLTALAASTKPEHNVVGIGIGPKLRKGKLTSQQSIHFYVERKVAPGSVPREFMIPERIRGVATDVIETGRFYALVPIAQQRHRPARGGCSVGFRFTGAKAGFVMAGTFGTLVTDASEGRFILSNNHVIADENRLKLGSPIFQPGLLDNGNPAKDRIATLTRFVRLRPSPATNRVDAAVARLDSQKLAVRSILPRVGALGSTVPLPAAVGRKVHKHGRTTGYTRGKIVDVSADVNVAYDFGTARFVDQIVIVSDGPKPFSDSGDSGSLIVDRTTRRATGLLFAGSASHTIANHITDVLAALKISLL
ncbi:MAG TPA: hypothetical protein VF530_16730 [Planctomycetota bacterium]